MGSRASSENGLVLVPSVHGMTAYVRTVREALERSGFMVCAVDYYGPKSQPDDLSSPPAMLEALRSCPQNEVLDKIAQARRGLVQRGASRTSLLGFCIGGTFAYHAARANSQAFRCLAMFYPNLEIPAAWGLDVESPLAAVTAPATPMIAHFGDDDEFVSSDDIATFRDRHDTRATVEVYQGAKHAFHDWSREERYQEAAAELAWDRTMQFFRKHHEMGDIRHV